VQAERTGERGQTAWSGIDWAAAEAAVRRLQDRIYRAAAAGNGRRVKNLQKLLVRSTSAKRLAVRRMTQQNAGRNTPGVDGVVCRTPESRTRLAAGLSLRDCRPRPVRRVRIPKSDGRTRPLGIPTIRDRALQMLVKMALEPEWETRFETNSYGFRPGRCTMDAIVALHLTLAPAGASEWLLDADISGCFDNLGHQPLLARLPAFTTTIRRWLKAGTVELGTWKPTTAGAPQGAPLSPLLANVALDGMERLFGAEDERGRHVRPGLRRGSNHGISLIRYADDLVVTAPTREVLETYVGPKLSAFLGERGLRLSEAKTRIVHIDEGFDFLGFCIRRDRRRGSDLRFIYTYPSKRSVERMKRKVKGISVQGTKQSFDELLRQMARALRGWAMYFRHGASKATFSYLGSYQWHRLLGWLKRKHRTRGWRWLRRRYSKRGWWPEYDGVRMFNPADIPIVRYRYRGANIPTPWTLQGTPA
jgi:RNA-directed DNA polymerase